MERRDVLKAAALTATTAAALGSVVAGGGVTPASAQETKGFGVAEASNFTGALYATDGGWTAY